MLGRRIESFSVASDLVAASSELRLDASFYNPRVLAVIAALKACDMGVKPLGELVERVYIPPRFKRVYVDPEHGVPFLQGSHIVQFQPADLKYLSRTAQKNLEQWIIKAGWILVTCSGTVGRVAIAPDHWNGWAASQHILRIIPRADTEVCPSGYLVTFLASPLGQAQLTAQIYGAVVDELTEDQASSVLVPVPISPEQQRLVNEIDRHAHASVGELAKAVRSVKASEAAMRSLLPTAGAPPDHPDGEEFERFRSVSHRGPSGSIQNRD